MAEALAGLRANEARYFKNKYDHDFAVEPASKAKKTIAWVHGILKKERDLVIASTPLQASAFQITVGIKRLGRGVSEVAAGASDTAPPAAERFWACETILDE